MDRKKLSVNFLKEGLQEVTRFRRGGHKNEIYMMSLNP